MVSDFGATHPYPFQMIVPPPPPRASMAIHVISVFDKVYKWSLDKLYFTKSIIIVLQKSENRHVSRFAILISPIDCCVRIKCISLTAQYWMMISSYRFLDSDSIQHYCIPGCLLIHLNISLYNTDIKVQFFFKSILHNVKQCL